MTKQNRYEQLIEKIFFAHYSKGTRSFDFERKELEQHAKTLRIPLPKNLGDLIYSFRYRAALPQSVRQLAPAGKEWAILPAGRARYRFALTSARQIRPSEVLAETKIPDATPSIISRYALSDEQALLAKVRYNRLIDVFSKVTCYPLQSHLRTFVPKVGQVETDELYVGVDRSGAHYVFPVQAKGGRDKLSTVQIAQDIAVCRCKFPALLCRPIGAQFMADHIIALFEISEEAGAFRVITEKHYRLVPADEITPQDLEKYKTLVQD